VILEGDSSVFEAKLPRPSLSEKSLVRNAIHCLCQDHMPVTTATYLQADANWSLVYFDVAGCANALLSTTKMLDCLDLALNRSCSTAVF
jgi:hypothetical protein